MQYHCLKSVPMCPCLLGKVHQALFYATLLGWALKSKRNLIWVPFNLCEGEAITRRNNERKAYWLLFTNFQRGIDTLTNCNQVEHDKL